MTDRATDRALADAGYMPISEYVRKWNKQMTDDELDAIRKRAEAATPGPWDADGEESARVVWCDQINRVCFMTSDGDAVKNSEFIAHAREDIPALLSALAAEKRRADEADVELTTLRARVAELEGAVWQALDDMAENGNYVCQATKDMLIAAITTGDTND